MMILRSIKASLYWCGISLAGSSFALHYLPDLIDAQQAVTVGYLGIKLSAGIMTLWALAEFIPAMKVNIRRAKKKETANLQNQKISRAEGTEQATDEKASGKSPQSATPKNIAHQESSRSANLQDQKSIDDTDDYDAEQGYKPQKYMFQYRDRIEAFVNRKLAKIDNAKPWIVSPPFASLNSITIDINPADKASLLYSTDFQTELLTKLPEGAELRRAGNGYKYPRIVIPRKKREFIPTGEALQWFEQITKNNTSMMLGYDDDMSLVTADLIAVRHLLILGTTGSGKGIATHNVMLSLLLRLAPDQLNLLIIDPKQGEFANYDAVPHLLRSRATNVETAMEYLTWLVDETVRRQRLFAAHQCNNLADYNDAHKKNPLPRIMLVFDEITRFYELVSDECDKPKSVITTLNSKLVSLATSARSAGVNMLLITQNSKDTIPAKLLSELPGRLAFKMKKHALQASETDKGDLDQIENLPGEGAALWFFETDVKRIQAPSIISPAKELPPLIAEVTKRYRDYPKAEFVQPDSEPETHTELASDDEIYLAVVEYVAEQKKMIQRDIEKQFGIGGSRCKRLIAAMEKDGFIGSKIGLGQRRSVDITPAKLRQKYGEASAKLPTNVIEFSR